MMEIDEEVGSEEEEEFVHPYVLQRELQSNEYYHIYLRFCEKLRDHLAEFHRLRREWTDLHEINAGERLFITPILREINPRLADEDYISEESESEEE